MVSLRGAPSFDVRTDATPDTLVCGFSEFGLAGLTAANYLVEQLGLEQVGYIDVDQLPPIAPFENGVPRRHTRLFGGQDSDLTVLVGELFVPPYAAESFGNDIVDWADDTDTEEIVVCSGVPIAHGPDDHRPFYVADGAYRERRLEGRDLDLQPMQGGFLDGVNGAIVTRGLDTDLRTAVFTTPAHAQTPDVEAALRLLDAVVAVYDLDLDTAPLEEFAAQVQSYYAELADRMAAASQEEEPLPDRMYM